MTRAADTIPAPPYVIRVARRDGAAAFGTFGNQLYDEANVYDVDDLGRRLAAAADGYPELAVSFRAGDSDDWLVMEPSTLPGRMAMVWHCPDCINRIVIETFNPDFALRSLATNRPQHQHQTSQ